MMKRLASLLLLLPFLSLPSAVRAQGMGFGLSANGSPAAAISPGPLPSGVIASSVAPNTVYPAAVAAGTYSNITLPAAQVAAGTLGGSVIASSIAATFALPAANIAAGTLGGSVIASSMAATFALPAAQVAAGTLGTSVIGSSLAFSTFTMKGLAVGSEATPAVPLDVTGTPIDLAGLGGGQIARFLGTSTGGGIWVNGGNGNNSPAFIFMSTPTGAGVFLGTGSCGKSDGTNQECAGLGTKNNQALAVTDDGRVAVGNTNPTVTLDVTGAIKSTASIVGAGGIFFNDGTIQTTANAYLSSSTYNLGTPANAQTAFAVCTTTLTITTHGDKVVLWFSGTGRTSSATSSIIGLSVMQDGAFITGYSSSVGMSAAQTIAVASTGVTLSFYVVAPAPSSASHSYCLTSKTNNGNFTFDATDVQGQFGVREVP